MDSYLLKSTIEEYIVVIFSGFTLFHGNLLNIIHSSNYEHDLMGPPKLSQPEFKPKHVYLTKPEPSGDTPKIEFECIGITHSKPVKPKVDNPNTGIFRGWRNSNLSPNEVLVQLQAELDFYEDRLTTASFTGNQSYYESRIASVKSEMDSIRYPRRTDYYDPAKNQ